MDNEAPLDKIVLAVVVVRVPTTSVTNRMLFPDIGSISKESMTAVFPVENVIVFPIVTPFVGTSTVSLTEPDDK